MAQELVAAGFFKDELAPFRLGGVPRDSPSLFLSARFGPWGLVGLPSSLGAIWRIAATPQGITASSLHRGAALTDVDRPSVAEATDNALLPRRRARDDRACASITSLGIFDDDLSSTTVLGIEFLNAIPLVPQDQQPC